MLKRSTLREIKNSLGRYLAILIIIALGVGLFSGLKVTKESMIVTLEKYLDDHNFYDYMVISTLGFDKSSADAFTYRAEGSVSCDVLCTDDSSHFVMKALTIPAQINLLALEAGKMPEKSNQCLVDSRSYTSRDIGSFITIDSGNKKETKDMFSHKRYEITGIASSPLYINYERGTSSIGNGTVSAFFYINEDGFDTDYYTEFYIDLDVEGDIYSSEFDDSLSSFEDELTAMGEAAADSRFHRIKSDAEKELSDGEKEYLKGLAEYRSEYDKAYSELASSKEKLVSGEKELISQEKKISEEKASLDKKEKELSLKLDEVNASLAALEASSPYMSQEEYLGTKAALETGKSEIEDGLSQISSGTDEIEKAEKLLSDKKHDIDEGWESYYKGLSLADSRFKEAEEELASAKEELEDGREDLEKLTAPQVFVTDRTLNTGYACFESDSDIINEVSKVFPVFFFMVAALVCITTMTRLIDEHRTQIGVLKALGYSSRAVMGKYLFYSGSAGLAGSLIGYFLCVYLVPLVIWNAYGIMYSLPDRLIPVFNPYLVIFSVAAALLCSMGTCLAAGLKEFGNVPAQLIRPKAPAKGKRIFLEKIAPVWKRLGFMQKVTARNIFRYKKRFLMMILGVAGCTALLVAGFGINDTIRNVATMQYETVSLYDYSLYFDDRLTAKERREFAQDAQQYTDEYIFVHEGDVFCDDLSFTLISSDVAIDREYIDLHNSSGEISYPGPGEAVVCESFTRQLDYRKGDTITLDDGSGNSMEVVISDVCENYINSYIYVIDETCKAGWGYVPEKKNAYVFSASDDKEGIYRDAAALTSLDYILGVSISLDMENRITAMMDNLNAVIVLIIVAAGALAFIVLYNLTNINITERIREIATIKVLGFYPRETSDYIFREVFILTGISAVVGLFLGKLLLNFIIYEISMNIIYFVPRLSAAGYLLSVALTFVFTAIVNITMYYRLKKISMIESLKSVE